MTSNPLAYSDVLYAVGSGDASLCLNTAKKYLCEFIVSEHVLEDASLQSLYSGSKLHLYRVV